MRLSTPDLGKRVLRPSSALQIKRKNAAFLLLLFTACIIRAQGAERPSQLTNRERAIVFAVQQELHAAHLEAKNDVCLGFGYGLDIKEGHILPELGHGIRSNKWCNRGRRGFVIAILPPVEESAPGIIEVEIETGDNGPIASEGEHFGTLLRKGSYTVRVTDVGGSELVKYEPVYPPDRRLLR